MLPGSEPNVSDDGLELPDESPEVALPLPAALPLSPAPFSGEEEQPAPRAKKLANSHV
jgi:hypothetical protein